MDATEGRGGLCTNHQYKEQLYGVIKVAELPHVVEVCVVVQGATVALITDEHQNTIQAVAGLPQRMICTGWQATG